MARAHDLSEIPEEDDSEPGVHLPGHPKVGVAILKCLQRAGGSAHRSAVYQPTADLVGPLSSPQMNKTTPTGHNAWRVRVNFSRLYLANSGLLRSTGKGHWTITPAGELALRSDDVLAAVKAAYKAYKQGKVAPLTPNPVEQPPSPSQKVTTTSALSDLAIWTSDPERFEAAVSKAFAELGFEASHIGGSGDTDVLVLAHRANPPYSVVVDAKTTTHGKVGDSQIHWHHIAQHRKDRAADYSTVIAVGFHGGLVSQKANEDKVALITAGDLQLILDLHRLAAFSQDELRVLFVPGQDGTPDLRELERVAQSRMGQRALLLSVIWASGEYLEGSEEAVTPEAVHAYLKAKAPQYGLPAKPTLEEVREAMAFLASAFVSIFERSATGFVLPMTPETAVRRLSLLAVPRASHAPGEN